MQIYFIGLLKAKLQSYLFICLFFIMFWGKNWGIEKLPVPSFVTPVFPYCISAIFVYKKRKEKKKENIYFMSVRSGSESPVYLFSFPTFF